MKLATIVTKSCLKDFLLMRKTFHLHHPSSEIHVACDDYCYNYISGNFKKVVAIHKSSLKDGNHVSGDEAEKKSFINVIDEKFKLAKQLNPSPSNPVLWCDVDHIFVNPIEDSVLESAKYFDAALTPHCTDGAGDEPTVGFFNCGFCLIFSEDFLDKWHQYYTDHEKYNLYYEQKPLEVVTRFFKTLNLPIGYNFGWWKFLSPRFGGNLAKIKPIPTISWEDQPIISFHFHMFKEGNHAFNKKHLEDFVLELLRQRGLKEDLATLCEIDRLLNEDI